MRKLAVLLALLATGAAEEPRYLIMLTDDGPQRINYTDSVINLCGMNASSRVVRLVTPALGSTMVLVQNGGHRCAPEETPDLVLPSYQCTVLRGSYAQADDCGYN
jgi:hypothetical protein